MPWSKPEELPLRPPGAHLTVGPSEETSVDRALRILIPRDGVKPGLPAVVTDEEYLARLASVGRKYHHVRYRLERWDWIVSQARSAFDAIDRTPPSWKGLPDNATAGSAFSVADLRLDAELEAMLFALRGGLDVLARLVAAHVPGIEGVHSYRRLCSALEGKALSSALSPLIERAWTDWVADLTERRDAAGHYVALVVRSEVRHQTSGDGGTSSEESFVAIPELGSRASISIWHSGLPLHTQTAATAVTRGASTIEAHGMFDDMGRLIVRRNGPLPQLPPMIDGDLYVRSAVAKLENHLCRVLGVLGDGP